MAKKRNRKQKENETEKEKGKQNTSINGPLSFGRPVRTLNYIPPCAGNRIFCYYMGRKKWVDFTGP